MENPAEFSPLRAGTVPALDRGSGARARDATVFPLLLSGGGARRRERPRGPDDAPEYVDLDLAALRGEALGQSPWGFRVLVVHSPPRISDDGNRGARREREREREFEMTELEEDESAANESVRFRR